MVIAVEGGESHSLGETVVAQVLVHITGKGVVTLSDEAEAQPQTGKTIEFGQRTRYNQVVVAFYQRGDVMGVGGDKTGIGLIDEHDGVGGNILHDTPNLFRCQSVACGVVG